MNREEALRCVSLARDALAEGDRERALRLLAKSIRMHATPEAESLLARLTQASGGGGGGGGASSSASRGTPPPPQRGQPSSSGRGGGARGGGGAGAGAGAAAAPEPPRHPEVIRILRCSDYYEILAVERTCSEADVRKAYRTLARVVHPDRNKTPGAEEAFKLVARAHDCLTNEQRRSEYDRFGVDRENATPQQQQEAAFAGMRGGGGFAGGGGRPFAPEMDDDDLLNFLFRATHGQQRFMFRTRGGGMRMGGAGYRDGWGDDDDLRRERDEHRRRAGAMPHMGAHGPVAGNVVGMLMQLAPFILLILFMLVLSMPSKTPFALKPSGRFTVEKRTDRHVPFYVASESDARSVSSADVHREYSTFLQRECLREANDPYATHWSRLRMGMSKSCDDFLRFMNGELVGA